MDSKRAAQPPQPQAGSGISYRPEIDGLRAVAVLPILFFHAGYSWIPGGYIGVDIFFVISGYLIGSILISQISSGRFTFRAFYQRRVRRIVPALLAVLLATLAGGYFFLLPDEYMALATATLASLTFVPNINFWLASSTYFGLDIATEPLLHTWSLGIEEQFYIFLPPLLLLLWGRLPRAGVLAAIGVLALLSFYCNLAMLPADAKFSFYMLPARAWELLAGVMLALLGQRLPPGQRVAELLAVCGIALCAVPMFLLSERSVFPGTNALFPVLGAALVIFATGQPGTRVARLLGSALPVGIGKISYSLYLWHWPVAVYARLAWPESPWTSPAVIVISLVAATLSYRLVEERYRRHGVPSRPVASLRELGILTAGTTAALALVLLAQGAPARIPAAAWQVVGEPATGHVSGRCSPLLEQSKLDNVICYLGAPDAAPSFALWGDSHANALAPALHSAATNLGEAGVLLEGSGCRPLLGVYRPRKTACRAFNDAAVAYLKAHPNITVVYLAGYWRVALTGQGFDNSNFLIIDRATVDRSALENRAVFRRGLARTAAALAGRKLVLVEDVPEVGGQFGKSVANHFVRQAWLGTPADEDKAYLRHDDSYTQLFNSLVASRAPGVDYLPLQEHLCEGNRCPLMRQGRLLYQDGDHLSRHGSLFLALVFRTSLAKATARPRASAHAATPNRHQGAP